MADLVAASGLSKGALYYYFPDKASFFFACVDRFFGAYLPSPDKAPSTLRAYVSALCEGYAKGLRDAAGLCGDSSAYLRFVLSVLPLRRAMLRDSYSEGLAALASLLAESKPHTGKTEALSEAERILALIEGTGVIAALEGDGEPLDRFSRIVGGYLDALA